MNIKLKNSFLTKQATFILIDVKSSNVTCMYS